MPQPCTARSLLFAPGDSPRKLEKAGASEADLILVDLEDAVAEPAKADARNAVAAHLQTTPRRQPHYVRINPLDGPHALHDLAAVVPARPDGILLPKASPEFTARLDHHLSALEAAAGFEIGSIEVLALAGETAAGMFELAHYAGIPRLTGLTWGSEDLAASLGAISNRDDNGVLELPYQMMRSLCLAGAATAGVAAIETIHADFRDLAKLETIATAARRAGFSGMMAIHPDQVPVINRAFSPSEKEIAEAQQIIDLFAANPGSGTIGFEGRMLDMPHLKRAQAILVMRR